MDQVRRLQSSSLHDKVVMFPSSKVSIEQHINTTVQYMHREANNALRCYEPFLPKHIHPSICTVSTFVAPSTDCPDCSE